MLVKDTRKMLNQVFHCEPQLVVRAPGRVNLIGEHTDYNAGFVLPAAINFYTEVSIAPRTDNQVHIVALDYADQNDQFPLGFEVAHHPYYAWANYARGVVDVINKQCGKLSHGFNIAISGNIPQGAGLSSSASYEVALLKAIAVTANLPLGNQQIALLAQRAENDFVGCKCGIMDQLISAMGEKDAALLIDCRSLSTEVAKIPGDWEIVIVNSNVQRGLLDSEYNLRRKQCEEAAQILGVKYLREATLADLTAVQSQMPKDNYRRARHVISDSLRAIELAQALPAADITRVRELMSASHESMKNDFEITHPAVDALVEIIAQALGDNGGVRMTGGGFGGCVVALAKRSAVDDVRRAVNENYAKLTGLSADIYICRASEGAHVVN